MLCSTGIVNGIIGDTVCKIIMLPFKTTKKKPPKGRACKVSEKKTD